MTRKTVFLIESTYYFADYYNYQDTRLEVEYERGAWFNKDAAEAVCATLNEEEERKLSAGHTEAVRKAQVKYDADLAVYEKQVQEHDALVAAGFRTGKYSGKKPVKRSVPKFDMARAKRNSNDHFSYEVVEVEMVD